MCNKPYDVTRYVTALPSPYVSTHWHHAVVWVVHVNCSVDDKVEHTFKFIQGRERKLKSVAVWMWRSIPAVRQCAQTSFSVEKLLHAVVMNTISAYASLSTKSEVLRP